MGEMKTTRRDFLKFGLSGLALAGCGGSDPMVTPAGNCLQNGTGVTIQSNHGHVLAVSKAEVAAAADKTYDITGTAGHSHTVTVTAANFAALARNEAVTVISSVTVHTHTVNIT